jgi:phosphatidylserine/phosphatidylglycerophosphate/cardiolipin synthase-like enzyme
MNALEKKKEIRMKIDLSYETVDRIVVGACKEYKDTLENEIKLFEQDPDEHWVHPDDVIHGKKMIVHLEAVIADFGG